MLDQSVSGPLAAICTHWWSIGSILGKMALAQARAGFDILGPSDMMDGRVQTIREALDKNGF